MTVNPTLNQNDMEALAFEMVRITPSNHLETWMCIMHGLKQANLPQPWCDRIAWWLQAATSLLPYEMTEEELSRPVQQERVVRYLRSTKTALTYYNTQTLHAFADGCRTVADQHPAMVPLRWWQEAVHANARAAFQRLSEDSAW